MTHSLIVLILTAVTCGLLGTFLTLRRLSMMADAISHTVLLGIVLAFFITHDINSPWLMFGAAFLGVVTVAMVEALGKTRLVKYDDAIGVVFPMLFGLAVILISRFARNAHLDTDIVLMGEVIFASLDTVKILGIPVAVSAVKMGIMLIIDLAFILLVYKELKISTFDEEYAALMGLPIGIIFYVLMTLTSLTAVAAFDAVGTVLVLSFFITPAASAFLLTKDLKTMLLTSALFGVLNSVVGFLLAVQWNASMSGMCAAVGTLTFCLVLLFHENGIITNRLRRRSNAKHLKQELLIVHLGNHAAEISDENAVDTIGRHLRWRKEEVLKVAESLKASEELAEEKGHYLLTPKGNKHYEQLCSEYGLYVPSKVPSA